MIWYIFYFMYLAIALACWITIFCSFVGSEQSLVRLCGFIRTWHRFQSIWSSMTAYFLHTCPMTCLPHRCYLKQGLHVVSLMGRQLTGGLDLLLCYQQRRCSLLTLIWDIFIQVTIATRLLFSITEIQWVCQPQFAPLISHMYIFTLFSVLSWAIRPYQI